MKELHIKANVEGTDEINKLNKSLETTNEEVAENTDLVDDNTKAVNKLAEAVDKLTDATKETGIAGTKSAKQQVKGLKSVDVGLKSVAKASGVIFLLNKGFEFLTSVLEKQQPVLDFLDTTMTAIALGVETVSDTLKTVIDRVSESTENFDALEKVFKNTFTIVKNLVSLALIPMKFSFIELKTVALALKLAYENIFGDDTSIKKAQDDLLAVKQDLIDLKDDAIESGKAIIESGKAIGDNFAEAIDEVKNISAVVGEEFGKIDAKRLLDQAKLTTALKNQAILRSAINEKLLQEFDAQAEKNREARDNINLTFKERQKASDGLKKTLEDQGKLMVENADIVIRAAQAELATNKGNIELQAKLITAQKERADVIATVIGFQTEQLEQDRMLNIEKIDAANAEIDKELEKTNILIESEATKLENVITANKAKVQSYIDAGATEVQGYRDAVAELEISEIEKTKAIKDETDKQKSIREAAAKKEIADALKAKQARIKLAGDAFNTISLLTDAFAKDNEKSQKRAFQIKKAASLALATIETFQAAQSAYASQLSIPTPDAPIRAAIAAGLAVAQGLARVAVISKTKFETTSAPAAPAVSTPSLPEISAEASTASNNFASGVGGTPSEFNQQQLFGVGAGEEVGGGAGINQPQRVVVLESDITTTQNRVKTIESNNEFGG